jgi:hypothetical protein
MLGKALAISAITATAFVALAGRSESQINPKVAQLIVPLSFIPDEAAVVRQFDADLSTRFAFARTIGAIVSSAGIADTAASRQSLVQTMLSSFGANQQINPVSGLAMPVDVRGNEAGLIPSELLNPAHPNGLIPIGLFNRLDLAPADWTDCGEHRIVYATKPNAPKARFFVIFEAKLPNPKPNTGINGCRPVASRWITAGRNAGTRNQLLDQFYYGGLTGFRPVVHYLNYGSFLGQVRTNAFVQFTKWQLREFRVLPVAANTLAFLPAPVASNPLAELYTNNAADAFQPERALFRTAFGATYVPQLRSVDETAPATTTDPDYREKLLNAMGAAIEFRSDEFQSDSQGNADVPASKAGTSIQNLIPANWSSPIPGRTVSRAQMLNRAGAITCGGCHQTSVGQPIGTIGGQVINWPGVAPGGFVHISENTDVGGHQISPALRDFFIPFRRKVTRSVYNRPLQFQYRLPLELLPGTAKLRTFQAPAINAAVSKRASSEALARQVLRLPPPPRPAPLMRNAVPLARPEIALQPQAIQLRRISDENHSEELRKPGAFVEFRRPH